jgi:hypothetical protein
VLVTLALLCAAPPMALGQELPIQELPSGAPATPGPPESRPLAQAGFGLAMGVPVGDFGENVDFSVGVNGHLGFGLRGGPIIVGVEGT